MKGQTTWITGARGFIGRHVARFCALQGDIVLGLGYGSWHEEEARLWGLSHWIMGDITADNLSKLSKTSGLPSRVIHLAGGSSVGAAIENPKGDFFRTVSSTVELLDWVRLFSPDTPIIVASSAAVYGEGHDGFISENSVLRPVSPYGHHKLMMESLCSSYGHTYGLKIVLARLFSIYGEGLTKQLLWDICNKLKAAPSTLTMGGTGQEARDWVNVEDVARILSALDKFSSHSSPAINVGTGIGTTVFEISSKLTRIWQKHSGGDLIPISFNGKSRPGDPYRLIADTQSLKNNNLVCERSIQTGIEDYCTWFYHQNCNSA